MTTGKLDLTHHDSIVNAIVKDNQCVRAMFLNYQACLSTDVSQREQLARSIIKHVSVQSFLEENVLYPHYPEILGEQIGKNLQQKSWDANQKARELLYDLDQNLKVQSDTFDATLAELMADLTHQMLQEEGDILLKLQQRATPEQLVEWGREYESKKTIAPTRPHPSMGSSTATGILTKPVDMLRDATRSSTTQTQETTDKKP